VNRPHDHDHLDALARHASAGDADAFASLVRALAPDWFRIAMHLLADAAAASDVVHEVTVKFYGALPTWRRDSSITTWTHRIAVNATHDALRTRRRATRSVPLEWAANVPAASDNGTLIGDPFARDAIVNAVAQLPPELATVVSLRYGADLGFAEIAAVLEIPQGTVSTRLRRALKLLGSMLAPTLGKE
jgi:RNA polymerase sigma-70 factor (ECF subfamily)